MAELHRHHALDATYAPGTYGASGEAPGVRLSRHSALAIVQVAAFAGGGEAVRRVAEEVTGLAPDPTPNRAVTKGDRSWLWIAPERWLLIASADAKPDADLAAAIPTDQGSVVDLSHARVALRLEGPDARTVLAKGCSLDFHPSVFGPGACAQSTLFHVATLIQCRGADSFDLFAARGFGQSLWEMLVDAALEFGCEVAADPA
ncbi:MAG: sarcosine oxidase subunit gamma family protein [Alphaproteobacteria bacterium]|nr:sarcosine oxidase subunit gamma family protein [Alphaproteobacteria bacterium]